MWCYYGGSSVVFLFFFNGTSTSAIYTYGHTLSLHDALPICGAHRSLGRPVIARAGARAIVIEFGEGGQELRLRAEKLRQAFQGRLPRRDAHGIHHGEQIGRAQSELQSLMRISYAVFCLKKKKLK